MNEETVRTWVEEHETNRKRWLIDHKVTNKYDYHKMFTNLGYRIVQDDDKFLVYSKDKYNTIYFNKETQCFNKTAEYGKWYTDITVEELATIKTYYKVKGML